jgi:hypothetical protein
VSTSCRHRSGCSAGARSPRGRRRSRGRR